MNRPFFCLMAFFVVFNATILARAAEAPRTIDVWPGVAPGEKQPAEKEPASADPAQTKSITGVIHPTLTIYRPSADADTGVAILVCPGGGYKNLAYAHEGEDVAKWLNTLGVTAALLKYRVPPHEGVPRYLAPLQDAQRSLSMIRSQAKELNLTPARIGMLGFSAGGHLTAAASTNFDNRVYEPIDSVDQVSCRPDFGIVIYPGGVIAKGKDELSPEIRVTDKTPPSFIVQANDDPVNSENAVFYYLALKRAHVPAELHIYAAGGHGFGIRASEQPRASWPIRCVEWMVNRGILKKNAAPK